ncbi:MAG: TerB family tellurite resistance protein [Bacteroidota bacterium]
MVIHEQFRDFVLFLYLHMAHADGSMHQQEESVVREKMKKLFSDDENPDAHFARVLGQYRDCPPDQLQAIIRDSFNHFSSITFAEKYRVYTDMYDIINADGRVDQSARSTLDQLREVINIGIETVK